MERQSLVQLPIAIAHRSPIGLVGDQYDEAALAAASSLMNEDGLRTVDIDPPWATELALHMFALMAPRARHRISQEFGLSAEAMLAEQPLEAFTQQFLENAARVTESDHQRARDLASNFRSRMDSWITDFSMIMTTTTISGPPPLGSLSGSLSMHDAGPAISRATAFTWWTNVLGWASVSLPIHVDNASTPRAIQLCAPRQNIQDLYNVARLLSRQATSGFCAQGEVSGAQ
jgi:Asp-tRNA(Asn)/Glu-tRNA(Gln) amidotransferase A subunit family amidase